MRKLEIVIIADDMTGAADTAVQFLPSLAPVYLTDHRNLKSVEFQDSAGALAVYTNTRALPALEAGSIVRHSAEALRDRRPARVFKKIDSTLRGNIGAEVEVLLEVFGLEASFIAPSFPDQGRTTFAGTHLVHGRPVSETEAAQDPLTPVTMSSLPEWIGRQTRLPVGHIGMDLLERETSRAANEVDRLQSLGVRHYTFDVTEQAHLDRIVSLAMHRYPKALLCGSAGLAQSLAASLGCHEEVPLPTEEIPVRDGHFLLVCGSASEILRRQVSELVKASPCASEILAPGLLADQNGRDLWEDVLQRAASTLCQHDLVLQIGPPESGAASQDPEILVRGLACFIGLLVKRTEPGGLFISGGDTASAVLDELKGHPVRLLRQISGGMVKGTLMGGLLTGYPVVTKAGGFGKSDTLLNFYKLLSRGISKEHDNHS